MHIVCAIAGILSIFAILLDAFETVVLPRRVRRSFRITSWFYRRTWIPWRRLAQRIDSQSRRENFLGYFGPLSLIFLMALWATALIFGFALLQYGAGEHFRLSGEPITFGLLIYHSGETFFTLGYGDIIPSSGVARLLAVVEAGLGFAFLGVVIGYLPTIYSSFSRREIEISLLDARAGSPPTAAELLSRFGNCPQQAVLDQIFKDWERWAAEVLESHLSYPALSFFSLAAQQPVVAGSFDNHSGRKRASDGRGGWIAQRAGENHLRHGAACDGRSGSGGKCPLQSGHCRPLAA